MDFFSELSGSIHKQRKALGWSQQQLADMAGLDRTTIGALERNAFSDIGIRKVQRVLQLMHRTLTIQTEGLPTLDDLQRLNEANES